MDHDTTMRVGLTILVVLNGYIAWRVSPRWWRKGEPWLPRSKRGQL